MLSDCIYLLYICLERAYGGWWVGVSNSEWRDRCSGQQRIASVALARTWGMRNLAGLGESAADTYSTLQLSRTTLDCRSSPAYSLWVGRGV